jgi:hypothetical protein
MREKEFVMGEAVRFGWDTMKANIGFFILLQIVVAGAFVYRKLLACSGTCRETATGAPGV